MTLALKSWMELRRRLMIGGLAWAFVVGMFCLIGRGDHGGRTDPPAEQMRAVCHMEIVMLMVFAGLLAGSGVLTQICNSTSARMPESVLFTLSLPVSRRSLFYTRALEGAVGALFMLLFFWLLLPLLSGMLGLPTPVAVLISAMPFQLLAAALAYSAALLGSCVLSDVVLAFAFGITGALGGMGAGLEWAPLARFLDFASGAAYMTSGHISWTGIVVCVALCCAFVISAVRIIERREF